MNFNSLKDNELHIEMVETVAEEKRCLTKVLHLLQEVESRKFYCDFGCRSLFDYATKILKYSEFEAWSRINAMKLLRQIPEIEKDLNSGEMTLTNLTQAQNFFKKSNIPDKSQKLEILEKIKNQSTRKVKELFSEKSEVDQAIDEIRELNNGRVEIRVSLSEDSFFNFQHLKNHFSKNGGSIGTEELLNKIYERIFIEKNQVNRDLSKLNVSEQYKSVTPKLRQIIKIRDQYQCKNCGSTRNLEIDHVKPQALGGTHDLSNLQTLCRPCNQRRAIKTFGAKAIFSVN